MRRPALRGAASDSGPLWGGPVATPRGSTTSQEAGWSGTRASLSRSQSAMSGFPDQPRSVRSVTTQERAHAARGVLVEETVQVEFCGADCNEAGKPEVARVRHELGAGR